MSQEVSGAQEVRPGWMQHLGDRLREWSAGRESRSPRFRFIVALGRHETEEDMTEFTREFNECDIFLPEALGWSPDQLQMVRAVSLGEVKPEGVLTNTANAHLRAEMKMLYSSGKAVGWIDVGRDTSLDRAIERLNAEVWVRGIGLGGRLSFAERLDNARHYLKGMADLLVGQRDAYVFGQIEPTLKEVLRAYPDLRSKPEVIVLLKIGAVHTGVYHQLKQ